MKKLILYLVLFILPVLGFSQGTTTGSLSGNISDQNGESLIGSTLTAVHGPSGTFYGVATDVDGSYRIDNMRVGGPYTITSTYVGQADKIIENVYIRLGEKKRLNIVLQEGGVELDEILVIASSSSVGESSGTSTQISTEDIEVLPTLDRDISDYVRLTPQANTSNGGIQFAGVNNRFNAIYVDGAVNNDVFGLAGSGTNGGQTGISPFSIDIIDQFQVVLSPYDVTQGGFAGGGINAVTKSGTNCFTGTAYYFLKNEKLNGKTNQKLVDRFNLDERTRVDDFTQRTYGASLGGPIIKNKVFFFVNAEIQKDETPSPFAIETYTSEAGRSSVADLENLQNVLMNQFGYDAGTFGDTSDEVDGTKLFGKLDINLNDRHNLTLRHNYTKAEQFNRNSGGSRNVNFSNNGIFFPTTTNSSALELNSRFSDKLSNNLIIGYTSVNDDRDPLGDPFPDVRIDDNGGLIRFGSEPFSTANVLNQKIFTITDNLKLYKGKHTFTLGTHNEFYDIRNVFLALNFGQYEFDSLDDFLNGVGAADYSRVYSLVDNVSGDNTQAAAEFNAMQLGFYVQDEIEVSNNLTVSAGLRLDIPIITDDPAEAPRFNDEVLPRLATQYDLANEVTAGQAPDGQLMFSPRLGFTYQMDNRISKIRGGLGIFTSRIPFVWPGAMFNTNGLSSTFIGGFAIDDIQFRPDVQDQYVYETPRIPSGDMNLFTNGFRYPQVFRGNLAYDTQIGNGWALSLEGIYTKTLNNIVYTNINTSTEIDFNLTGSGDNRPVYVNSELDDDNFNAVYVGSNTSEGYGYNLTATVAKRFNSGLNATIAYTYGDSYALSEGTSSQNSSGWRGQVNVNGRNDPSYGRSDFSAGSRLLAVVDYTLNYGANSATTFSLFYNGQSGRAFSYVIGGRNARNLNQQRGSTTRNRSLVYVPVDANDINLIDTDGISAAQQWDNLNALIESESSLNSRRGEYAEKNGARAPWVNFLDFAIRQDFGADLGGNVHKFQLSFDVFNVGNLINSSWGARYNVPGDFNNYFLLNFEGYEDDGTTPQYTYTEDQTDEGRFDISDGASRWSARVGLRYTFGGGNCSATGNTSKSIAGPGTELGPGSVLNSPKRNKRMDSDGDGVRDSKDVCPDIPGLKKFKGCPMSEADMAAKAAADAKAKMEMEEKARVEAANKAKMEAEKRQKAAAEAAKKAKAEAEAKMKAQEEAKMKAFAAAEALKSRNAEISRSFNSSLQGLKFNSSAATFKKESYDIMDQAVATLNQYPDINILIQGHTDSQGAAENNRNLSQKRADAVRDYLVSKGIDISRVSTSGLGEEYPIADNNTAAGRAQNRRVEFIVRNN